MLRVPFHPPPVFVCLRVEILEMPRPDPLVERFQLSVLPGTDIHSAAAALIHELTSPMPAGFLSGSWGTVVEDPNKIELWLSTYPSSHIYHPLIYSSLGHTSVPHLLLNHFKSARHHPNPHPHSSLHANRLPHRVQSSPVIPLLPVLPSLQHHLRDSNIHACAQVSEI